MGESPHPQKQTLISKEQASVEKGLLEGNSQILMPAYDHALKKTQPKAISKVRHA